MTIDFKHFLNIVDMEIQQTDKANILSVKDKGRKAVQSQIIKWTNGALNFLTSVNPEMWFREEVYTVPVSTEELELPFYWKSLKGIVISNVLHRIGSASDSTSPIYATSFNTIKKRAGSFTEGEEITIIGNFNPQMLTDPLREDYYDSSGEFQEDDYYTALELVKSEYIDIPAQFIDLLKLKVCLSYSARQEKNSPQWWADYNMQLDIFKYAQSPTSQTGGWSNEIAFGRL